MTRNPKPDLKSLGHPAVKPATRKAVRSAARKYAAEKLGLPSDTPLHTLVEMKPRVVVEAYEAVGYKAPYKVLTAAKAVNRYKKAA